MEKEDGGVLSSDTNLTQDRIRIRACGRELGEEIKILKDKLGFGSYIQANHTFTLSRITEGKI